MFYDVRGCMYDYSDGPQDTAVVVAREVDDDDDRAAAARDVLPAELRKATTFCWGLGLPANAHTSSDRRRRCCSVPRREWCQAFLLRL
jgi:hypothetical protein